MMVRTVQLCIGGTWRIGTGGTLPVCNPANGEAIADLSVASAADIDSSLQSAAEGFRVWRAVPSLERQNILRRAANILRKRQALVGGLITDEQGKPLSEALVEADRCAEILDWYADEGRRSYGRLVPSRAIGLAQEVRYEPIGPVAAFSPWNFPASQAAKKLAAALAAGCSIVLKGPEEAPSACAELVRALYDAGASVGSVSLLFGKPAMISEQLIQSDVIRKVSFTGSVPVGKQLAILAAKHMKPCTMELGGHAPVIICDDADLDSLIPQLVRMKFRNAGQVCVAPSRFFVQQGIYERFVAAFTFATTKLIVGEGREGDTQVGPLANPRRVAAMEECVADAVAKGAILQCGGEAPPLPGYYFVPTVLSNVPDSAKLMRDEIFGPVVPISSFVSLDDVIEKANGTSYGLSAYVFTSSGRQAQEISERLDCGMVSVNYLAGAAIEMPFGGRSESGYGSEGGHEGLFSFLVPKAVNMYHRG